MNRFSNIDIRVETSAALETGNIPPVMNEIRHALERFLESGEVTVIDLMAMPFAPGELQRLLEQLEGGEVSARVDALGETLIRESHLAGVWIVDHYNTEQQRIALQIEITEVPRMLCSQQDDIAEAVARLAAELQE